MSEPSHAVFVSYASQDAQAAQKICEALRAAGIEVWFDQSELRGGDAWDRRIREQIHHCRLFIATRRNRGVTHQGQMRVDANSHEHTFGFGAGILRRPEG